MRKVLYRVKIEAFLPDEEGWEPHTPGDTGAMELVDHLRRHVAAVAGVEASEVVISLERSSAGKGTEIYATYETPSPNRWFP